MNRTGRRSFDAARMLAAMVTVAVLGLAGLTGIATPAGASPGWSVVSSPTPAGTTINTPLYSVSCATTTSCMTVGPSLGDVNKPYASRWNGTTWTATAPKSAPGSILFGVSCGSATFCMAVGTYNVSGQPKTFAERWNGSTWTITASPNPAGAAWLALSAVSCASSSQCLAVGTFQPSGTALTKPYVLRWNGSTWTVAYGATPASASYTALSGVSCASVTRCTVVGQTNGSGATRPFVETWNGTGWAKNTVPLRSGAAASYLAAVSCASTTQCIAVGTSSNAQGSPRTLVYRSNGSTWSMDSTPTPSADGSVMLSSVSCPTTSDCQAIGHTTDSNGVQSAFVERGNGSAWSLGSLPAPSPTPGTFNGVSCASASMCIAAGYRGNTPTFTWTARWNGTSWSTITSPTPAKPGQSILASVACPGATDCLAVGERFATDQTLAERWNGSSWAVVATPNVGTESRLEDIACATSSLCFGVGWGTPTGNFAALVERWNGSTWTVESTPTIPGSFSELTSVACPGATTCFAVGTSSGGTLVERWNGSSWTVAAAPTATNAQLVGVACASTTDCLAVGSTQVNLTASTFTLHWNGSTWTKVTSPNRAGSNRDFLTGVSCVSKTWCEAVGWSDSGTPAQPVTKTLVEHWNGSSWSIVATPNPANDHYILLNDVSCSSTSSCVAVGTSSPELTCSCEEDHPTLGTTTLVERWNGAAWAIEPAADPAGATARELNGVSCLTGTPCFAVGAWQGAQASNVTHTLVERYQ